MSNIHQEIMEKMRKEREENERRASSGRAVLIKLLREHGVKKVFVGFDGCGDSGNVGEPMYHAAPNGFGSKEAPNTTFESRIWEKGGVQTVSRNKTINELVEDLCYTLLSCSRPGWEINEGAFGEFTIDVEKDAVALEFNQRIESVETSEEDF